MKIFERISKSFLFLSLILATALSSPAKRDNDKKPQIKTAGEKDVEVQQLEDLKQQIAKDENQISNDSPIGTAKAATGKNKDSDKNEKLVENLKRGINKKSEIHRQLENMREVTPEELAFYIAKTGDEDGVSLIVQEMISENVVTSAEAAEFLNKIRENLKFLKEEQNEGSTSLFKRIASSKDFEGLPGVDPLLADPLWQFDYESRLEATPQESYEEVLYQLAKMIFSLAAEGGDVGREEALREISLVLSTAEGKGAVSTDAKKRIIEIVVSALTDTLGPTEPDYFISDAPTKSSPNLLYNSHLFKMANDNTQFAGHNLFPQYSSLKSKRDVSKA